MATLDGIEVVVGDKVFSLLHGWGTVIGIRSPYVEADFSTGNHTISCGNGSRLLYWDEVVITPPPKPKKKVKKWRWVMRYFDVDDLYVTGKHYSEEEVERLFSSIAVQKVYSTEIEE